jgi:hypothetical protein
VDRRRSGASEETMGEPSRLAKGRTDCDAYSCKRQSNHEHGTNARQNQPGVRSPGISNSMCRNRSPLRVPGAGPRGRPSTAGRSEVDFELDVPDRPGRQREPGSDQVRSNRPTPLGASSGGDAGPEPADRPCDRPDSQWSVGSPLRVRAGQTNKQTNAVGNGSLATRDLACPPRLCIHDEGRGTL